MIYREYGKTGKKVSLLGFGGMRFKPEDLTDDAGLHRCAEIVRCASREGVNYFDTAPGYCNGKSEEIFGIAFRDMPHPFYVSTKSSITSERTADEVFIRIKNSLLVMGISKIHFFHMWSILDLDQYQRIMVPGGPYEGAVQAREEGLIDHICFSTHCPPDDIIRIINDGFFEGVTISFNVINYGSMLAILEAAGAKQMGVATMNSLGGGIIPQNPGYFAGMNTSSKSDVTSASLRFNSSFREVSIVLSGMTDMNQVVQNAKALSSEIDTYHPYDRPVTELSFSSDKLCSGCGYCRECPERIPIPEYMQAYNYRFFPDSDFMGMSISWFDDERKAANNIFQRLRISSGILPESVINPCIQCGSCESVCTQKIPIISRLYDIFSLARKSEYSTENLNSRINRCFEDLQGKKAGLYPAGVYTESLINYYHKTYGVPDFELFIFDGNSALWGQNLGEFQILSPEEIVIRGIDRIIITNLRYQEEIAEKLQYLKEQGVELLLFHGDHDLFWF